VQIIVKISSLVKDGLFSSRSDSSPCTVSPSFIHRSFTVHTTVQTHAIDRFAPFNGRGDTPHRVLEEALKTLPPGSVYSEPAGDNHFARTDTDPVIVEISGYGPTDTHYFEAKNAPKASDTLGKDHP